MTLTDEDLKELGISTFGARKKMLLTIQGELCPVLNFGNSDGGVWSMKLGQF